MGGEGQIIAADTNHLMGAASAKRGLSPGACTKVGGQEMTVAFVQAHM